LISNFLEEVTDPGHCLVVAKLKRDCHWVNKQCKSFMWKDLISKSLMIQKSKN